MEVASIRHLEQNGTGKLRMGLTKTTVKGTALFNSPVTEIGMGRILRSLPFRHGWLASPYDRPERTVVPALLDHKNLVAL
jgi:hypothetical protein